MAFRKKIFEMDGLKIEYSPLSVKQTEDVMSRKRPTDDIPAAERLEFFRKWNRDVLCFGLNNAAGTDEWTPEKLNTDLDPVVYDELEMAILRMTKLVKNETPAVGESAAATL
jgi:hypothetical protein